MLLRWRFDIFRASLDQVRRKSFARGNKVEMINLAKGDASLLFLAKKKVCIGARKELGIQNASEEKGIKRVKTYCAKLLGISG